MLKYTSLRDAAGRPGYQSAGEQVCLTDLI